MPAGRPTKLTSEVIARVDEAIRSGCTQQVAAEFAGISLATFKSWIKQAEEGNENYREFLATLKKAEREAEVRMLQKLTDAKEWQATAWILERRHPERWRRKSAVEHSGPDGAPIEFSKIERIIVDPIEGTDE